MTYDRKYWGPYSPLPRVDGSYFRVVYPVEECTILKHGKPHLMRGPELDEIHERMQPVLARSMVQG